MKRSYLMFLLCIASALSLRASPPIGAVVQAWHYDPQTNFVTLQIINTSQKDITAFNIAIKETYANGLTEEHELTEELICKVVRAKELEGDTSSGAETFRKLYGNGAFHPGERDEKVAVQPELKDFQAVIDVAAYIDGTADSANDAALKRLVDDRKVAIATQRMATEIIKTALADPNDPDACMTATGKIHFEANARKNLHTKMDTNPMLLELTARNLKTVCLGNVNRRDALKQFADSEDARISIMSVHAALTKNGHTI